MGALERHRAWLAGVVAVLGIIVGRKELMALLGCFVILAGCVDPVPVGYALPRPGQHFEWRERPVHVLVSEDLDPDCVAAIDAGLGFWYDHGVRYLEVTYGVLDELTQHGELHVGEIGVTSEEPSAASHAGSTTQYAYDGEMVVAVVRLRPEFCMPELANHELGHAMGLPDEYGEDHIGNVMFWALPGLGDDVTPEQETNVR